MILGFRSAVSASPFRRKPKIDEKFTFHFAPKAFIVLPYPPAETPDDAPSTR